MTPLEIILEMERISQENGHPTHLRLLPGMSEAEIQRFEEGLPSRLPSKIRELLTYCRGFESAALVDFSGVSDFEFADGFPYGHPIGHDGSGNYWVVDLSPASADWGPIYYVSHDPPVILCQCESLETFLQEVVKTMRPPFESLIDEVRNDVRFQVWSSNPGVMTQAEAASSPDPALANIAGQLSPEWLLVDLRGVPPGMGFSWGRYGADTDVRRFGDEPIFAYRKAVPKPGLFQRLLKR